MKTRRSYLRSAVAVLALLVLTPSVQAKSCLWKVSSDNGTFYLQGSVHILKADNYPLAPAIEAAYADSQALVLEADIKEMSSPEAQQRILMMALLPGTNTLRHTLNEATYQQLSDACSKAGMPVVALDKYKPWFATMMLVLTRLQGMGFNPQHGLDSYFHTKAEADGKKVIGLESVEFQINLFESLSEANPNDFVARALSDLDLIEQEVNKLETAWESGDIESLGKLMYESFKDYPEFYKTFVLDRNEKWMKTMKDLLTAKDTHMVVVGAGHLAGKGGLLELLKNEGYTLEQL